MMTQSLSVQDLDDLAVLERSVRDADGVTLKLEWHYLRTGRVTAALIHRDAGSLVGFVGLYSFGGPPEVELVGMVAPSRRRNGIAAALLAEALEICGERGLSHRLMVIPRSSSAGIAFARASGGVLEHSEHALVLTGAPTRAPEDPAVTVREAVDADRQELVRILTSGFGPPPDGMLRHLHERGSRTLLVEYAGAAVGTLRASLDGDEGGVFGFAVDAEHRGRGIGRDVLGRVCAQLRSRGAHQVRLEVAVENDTALHLYTYIGFAPRRTDDYYLLPA